uniref:Uncharacterized protein n=1 Tax=Daphnia galeata TaxID=27404 RepID=A0A8J2RP69_9CRUS|nr:unnamed protein product [Daphnia galeata]
MMLATKNLNCNVFHFTHFCKKSYFTTSSQHTAFPLMQCQPISNRRLKARFQRVSVMRSPVSRTLAEKC